jgi:hypothetical protein
VPALAPHYQPEFSAADLAHARDVVRRSTSRQDHARRARLALELAANPALSNPEAGRRVGLHPNAVRYWRKTWCSGPFRLTDLPGRGRKPRLPPLCGDHRESGGLR